MVVVYVVRHTAVTFKMAKPYFTWCVIVGCLVLCVVSVDAGDKVKLKDVQTLTLTKGRYTTGRRSSPIPQLNCIGGSAGCRDTPSVVQCYNRGSDGHDVQWECKADMSKSLRFGEIMVACEGYNYADDEYILKGSCGLEYKLESIGDHYQASTNWDTYSSPKKSPFQNLLFIGVVCFIIFVIYKSCLPQHGTGSARDGGVPPDDPTWGSGGQWRGGGGGPSGGGSPPPPGFNPSYGAGASCGSGGASTGGMGMGMGSGGFWTGAAAGGLMGYLMGNRG